MHTTVNIDTRTNKPIIKVLINGKRCRALIDTGSDCFVWVGQDKILTTYFRNTFETASVRGVNSGYEEKEVWKQDILIPGKGGMFKALNCKTLRNSFDLKDKNDEEDNKKKKDKKKQMKSFDILLPYNAFSQYKFIFDNDKDNRKYFIIDTGDNNDSRISYEMQYDGVNLLHSNAVLDTESKPMIKTDNILDEIDILRDKYIRSL